MQNQVLQILIPNSANGYQVIKLTGWEGTCFILPRTELKSFSSRNETRDPGIYFLFGDSDESTNQKLYIGESERFYDRLISHDVNKDFWNRAVIFTGGIDKANVKYLEYLATTTAKAVGRYDLTNSVFPKENSLSEFSLISTQNYFEKMSYILDVLALPVFKSITESTPSKELYYLKGENFEAQSQLLSDGSLNVLVGSTARSKESNSFEGWALSARKTFIEDGTFKKNEDELSYIFTRDVLFKSPSAAAATITGRSINGWTAWKDSKGKTLDENLRS